ncbi:AAA family ATPase [Candidatus Woesearchaeota archaeon]|nr:AAA family ATPase [Candidatus Woesearchaeota archaeon]
MWYESYGWKDNPFSIKTSTDLVGLDEKKKELLNYIVSGDICFLNGPTGIGKTSLLKWIERNLKDHQVFYIDAAGVKPDFSLTNYLKDKTSFFSRLFGDSHPKNTVILLDESQDCDEELLKALKLHWDHQHIKSIVVTQISSELERFSESFKDRIGGRIVNLKGLDESEGYDLIKLRLEGKNPFDTSAIEAILGFSSYIPRKILENCEIVCAKNSGKKFGINAFDVEQALFGKRLGRVRIFENGKEIIFGQYKNIEVENKENVEQEIKERSINDEIEEWKYLKKEQLEENEDKEDSSVVPLASKMVEKKEIPKFLDKIKIDQYALSPMEKSIVTYLTESEKTAKQLASILNTSEGSVGKQLSKLINKDLVKITKKDRPKHYGLIKKN